MLMLTSVVNEIRKRLGMEKLPDQDMAVSKAMLVAQFHGSPNQPLKWHCQAQEVNVLDCHVL